MVTPPIYASTKGLTEAINSTRVTTETMITQVTVRETGRDRLSKYAVDATFFSKRFITILLKDSVIGNRVRGMRKKQKLYLQILETERDSVKMELLL